MMDKEQYQLVELLKNAYQGPTEQEDGYIYCWLKFDQLEKFANIVGSDYLTEDGGMDARIQDNCVCIVINELLEHFDIDKNVFEGCEI